MKIFILFLTIIWICCWSAIKAANILIVFPYFTRSHFGFHIGIAKSLHKAGHNITVVHCFPEDKAHENFTFIDVSSPDNPKEYNHLPTEEALQMKGQSMTSLLVELVIWAAEESEKDCIHTCQSKEIQAILSSNEKVFDVMIVDMLLHMNECYLSLAEALDIPVIGTIGGRSKRNIEWLMGSPYHPAVVPLEISSLSHKMNFEQRLRNTWYQIVDYLVEKFHIVPKLKQFRQKYFPNLPTAKTSKPSLLFLNSHQVFIPRALTPNIINIGGIHVPEVKPLPKEFQTFLDKANDGAILFTFGSFLRMFRNDSKEVGMFKKVFAQIPQRVIWKTEEDIENLPDNVLISKWLPQRDILAHKNVVAFMTHCGLAGIFEAISEAKPLLMFPLFYDQLANANLLEELGAGLILDVQALTVNKMLQAINNIVNDTQYKNKMLSMQQIIRDNPMTPQESVVYWTEYVIRHNGARHLQTAAADMPLFQYLLLDVIAFVLVIFFSILFLSIWLFKKVFKCFGFTNKKEDSRKRKND